MRESRDFESSCPEAIEIGAYILGALEPAEQDAFEHHLRRCPRCQRSLEQLQRSVEVVASAVERRQAPPELKRRIMAAVEAERSPKTLPRRAPRRLTTPVSVGFAGAFAALAVALFLAFGGGLSKQSLTIRGSARRGATGATTYAAVVAPQLHGTTVLVERAGERAYLVGYNLPAPPPGKVYELWVAGASGQPLPAGLFRPGEGGVTRATIERPLAGVTKVMVTVEPQGGTLRPTSSPIVIAAI